VLDWAREWLGVAPMPVRRLSSAHLTRRETAKAADLALRLWDEATSAAGTIVETYLRQRGLSLPPRSDEVLRFHPACPRGGLRLPAMLGLMRDIRPGGGRAPHLPAGPTAWPRPRSSPTR
jgi:hypothetical protein